MKVLITGSEGFIGTRVKSILKENKIDTISYDIKNSNDILDEQALEANIKNADIILHIAAQANLLEMEDIAGAKQGVNFNVDGTHKICYLCSKHKKKLIYASTVCVYGNIRHKATENCLLNPSELYAFSKLAGELLVKGYSLNFDLKYIILRFATTYGPGMRSALGTSVFFKQALAGNDITVHGDGKQTRTLTYVDDIALGCLNAIKYFDIAANNTFNISNTEKISALKMAKDIKQITRSKSDIVFIKQRNNQTFHENICNRKAHKLLKWKPKHSWRKGLYETYKWLVNS